MFELEEIAESFELLGDWEDRYAYLVELGEQLPPMPPSDQVEENRVKACMSKVWVRAVSASPPYRERVWQAPPPFWFPTRWKSAATPPWNSVPPT